MRESPRFRMYSVNDVNLAVWEWAGEGAPIVLCHATGFHGRCWDQIAERLTGRRVIAFDFRGHGRSTKPHPPYKWRSFGTDLAQLARALRLRGARVVGHSMGGHSAVLAAALNPEAFASLLLLDPVILPPEAYTGPNPPLDFVKRRRNDWESPDELFERFKTRPPFDTWDPSTLRDYCDHALNGRLLACPPDVEASIYANSSAPPSNIYAEIATVQAPVQIVRSRSPYVYGKFDGSPTDPNLHSRFRNATDTHWTDVSHFIPMEAPAKTAELILSS